MASKMQRMNLHDILKVSESPKVTKVGHSSEIKNCGRHWCNTAAAHSDLTLFGKAAYQVAHDVESIIAMQLFRTASNRNGPNPSSNLFSRFKTSPGPENVGNSVRPTFFSDDGYGWGWGVNFSPILWTKSFLWGLCQTPFLLKTGFKSWRTSCLRAHDFYP